MANSISPLDMRAQVIPLCPSLAPLLFVVSVSQRGGSIKRERKRERGDHPTLLLIEPSLSLATPTLIN